MSEFLCSMPYLASDDAEAGACWSEKRVVARKKHRCDECFKPIAQGQSHGRASNVSDGRWNTCPACMALAEWVALVLNGCPLWGGLSDFVMQANDELRHQGKPEIPYPSEYRAQWDAAEGGRT